MLLFKMQCSASHIKGDFSLIIFYLFTFFFSLSCLVWCSVHAQILKITSVLSELLNDVEVVKKEQELKADWTVYWYQHNYK